jgi:uncharacterized protein (TIGR03435 family)
MVSGGPKWLDSDRYDILAKAESSVADKLKKLTPDQRMQAQQEMLQSLLAERLKLVIHRETREYPVYFLTIAKNGPKLKEAKSGDPYENAFPYADKFADHAAPGVIFLVSGRPTPMTQTIYAFGVSIPRLAWNLTFWSQRIVQDRTGLRGSYDLTLTFCRNSPSGSSAAALDVQTMPSASDPCGAPTLLAAVQQQLGLRMDSGKGPVEIIVIDHVERPSQN